jgi:hypothetical protein
MSFENINFDANFVGHGGAITPVTCDLCNQIKRWDNEVEMY